MQLIQNATSWIAPVARWALWDAAAQKNMSPTSAELDFIEPMLRRRLSRLAKMTLKVAHECAHDLPSVRFVYASRHGDLTRTTTMLEDLAAGEILSPTAFSMSVLNASAGLFSILRHDTAPAIAISAATESFGFGLLEACLQLAQDPQQPVLLVYADEPAPEIYGQIEQDDCNAHAIGVLLQRGASDTISCAMASDYRVPSNEAQSRAFMRCLDGTSASVWHGTGKSWAWNRLAQ